MVGAGQLWLAAITTSQNDFVSLIGPAMLGGVGLSLLFVPISIAILSAVPPAVVPKATAFQSLSLQLGGSFSTAALVTLLAQRNAFHQETLAQSRAHQPFAHLLGDHGTIAQFDALIVPQATVMSFADCQFALGILAFVLMPVILVLPGRRRDAVRVQAAMD